MKPEWDETQREASNTVKLTRVLLVEDEPLWQEGIRSLLSLEGNMELVGVADTFEAGLATYESMKPDVVLLDWKLAGERDGLELGEALARAGHAPERLILVSGSDRSLIPANPYGFVPKPRIASMLVPAIRDVAGI